MNKYSKILFAILITLSFTVTGAWAEDKPILRKSPNGNSLITKAQNQGSVRILVRLAVPNVKELTAASNAHKRRTLNKLAHQKALKADAELAMKISSVAKTVVSQLRRSDVSYTINHSYSTLPLLAMDVSEAALKVLDSAGEVVNIVEDRLLPPVLDNTTSVIGADESWNAGYTGEGWYVAVLDTGILSSHQFFDGKAIEEACYSAEGHCPNDQTEMTGPGAAAHHPSTYWGWDHGTHVAGIATGNNGSLFGVAKDSDIIAVQVFSRFSGPQNCGVGLSNCVLSWTSDQIMGLEYVYLLRTTYKIASVNISIGGGNYSSQSVCDSDYADMKTAIDNLHNVGIATIISSGNDGYCNGISAPACISSAIAVGATTDGDAETSFNNWHADLLDLFAPGYEVYSSTGGSSTSYESWDGTSMAAPHVAGTWALLRQKNPYLSVASLLSTVSTTGVSVATSCFGQVASKARIKVDSALSTITPASAPAAPSDLEAAAVYSDQINLIWQDNSDNEDGFRIERKTGAEDTYVEIAAVGSNVTTYNDTGLSKVTLYHYRVAAYNSVGDSDYSNETSATTTENSRVKAMPWIPLLLDDE